MRSRAVDRATCAHRSTQQLKSQIYWYGRSGTTRFPRRKLGGRMEQLRPAVRPTFRSRSDLLPSADVRGRPRTPPPVSFKKLLARVHNPELRKAIVDERAKNVAARAQQLKAISERPKERRRLQTPPTPDLSDEWSYYQSGQAREKRRLRAAAQRGASHTSRVLRSPREPVDTSPPMRAPRAATSRAEARAAVRKAFDTARATRDYWSVPVKPALQPPTRTLSEGERMQAPGPTARWPSPPKTRIAAPWRAPW
jgi:hypothetical protein